MTPNRNAEYMAGLVRELRRLPVETDWIEFKQDNCDPEAIGEYISALANSAALAGKTNGYVVWGIENATHEIIGTNFSPSTAKKGNEPLETWLLRSLKPKIHFRFFELEVEGRAVVLLEIDRAFRHPVRFHNEAFVRVGEVKKLLRDAPDRERALWRALDQTPFEGLIVAERLTAEDTLRLLDYPKYFDLLEQPLPTDRDGILDALKNDALILPCEAGGWNITNLGALLFAKHLADFSGLKRKAVRVIQYRGKGRTEAMKEQEGNKGYATGFAGLVDYINNLLPANEMIRDALRKTVPMFPVIAIRELVANALIH